MSYCVNCGVELAPSEKRCPLCGVEVANPLDPWVEPRKRPYPKVLEKVIDRVDRRYGAGLASILLLIPLFVSVLTNMLTDPETPWSLYVAGALICVFVIVLLPLVLGGKHLYLSLAADFAAVTLYVLMIEFLSHGDWFLSLGLPLCVSAFAAVFVAAFSIKRITAPLAACAAVIATAGLLTVAVEGSIALYLSLKFPSWSPLALVPCLMISALLLYIENHNRLKDQIKRRLFY